MASSLQAQPAPAGDAGGSYIQPSSGVVVPGVVQYRDTQVSVHVSSSAAAPGAIGTIATCTPGTAGIWEISGTVSISGTTVAANETNNIRLRATGTTILDAIPIGVTGTTGSAGAVPFGPVRVTLTAANTVNLVSIAAGTGSSIYGGQIICTFVSPS